MRRPPQGPGAGEPAGRAGPAGKTPWKTPAPVFADPKTPGTAAPASGWQQLYEGGAEEDTKEGDGSPSAAAAPAEPAEEWVDDGSLPVEKDGTLPFYLVDAHEELYQPGAVFLFGKVCVCVYGAVCDGPGVHSFHGSGAGLWVGICLATHACSPAAVWHGCSTGGEVHLRSRMAQRLLMPTQRPCPTVSELMNGAPTPTHGPIPAPRHHHPAAPRLPRQVTHNGQHMSCCAVVRGLQRNLFIVPREEVGSEEISRLEAAAATDPQAKKQLIPLLHVSGSACWGFGFGGYEQCGSVCMRCGVTPLCVRW